VAAEDEAHKLIFATALCTLLLETLEQIDHPIASEHFIADLQEVCERARAHLTAIRLPT
jgi:hypothetical protein